MTNTWTRTRADLEELENLLLCGICRQLIQEPKVLGNCEHFFCGTCLENNMWKACPECGVPFHVKDLCYSRQLATAVSLCQNLSFLLMRDSLNLPDTPTSSQKKTEKRTPKRKDKAEQHFPDIEIALKFSASFKEGSPTTTNKRPTRGSAKSRQRESGTEVVSKKPRGAEPSVENPEASGRGAGRRPGRRQRVLSVTETQETETSSAGSAGRVQTPAKVVVKTRVKTPGRTPTKTRFKTPVRVTVRTPVRTPESRAHRTDRLGSPFPTPGGTPTHLKKNAKGETALHVAIIKGDYDRARSLIDEGAEVNTKDNAGWTPLHEACNHGYVALVELLLDSGSFINVPGGDNETPLHDAVLNNRVKVAELLISRGADKQAKNLSGATPRDLAKTDVMRETLDATNADSQLDTSVTTVPSTLSVGPVVLLATGLNREDRARVQKCATLLHGRMVTDFCNEVTHLVTSVNKEGQCPRTLKFLLSMLMGKWIINKDWVDTCLEYGERLSEEAFEVPGCSTNPDSFAPQKARLNSVQQLPGLFDGCHFFMQGAFSYPTPTKHDLGELLAAGGGRAVSRLPKPDTMEEWPVTVPYHARPGAALAACSHYIVSDSRSEQLELLHPRLARVSSAWLMDCIARFDILETTKSDTE